MATELQAQIEAILREHPKKSAQRIAGATLYRVLAQSHFIGVPLSFDYSS
jgi:hypothetical protein